ncbi:MAG: hypothetical protein ACLRUL_10700 [Clostridia bacterium]
MRLVDNRCKGRKGPIGNIKKDYVLKEFGCEAFQIYIFLKSKGICGIEVGENIYLAKQEKSKSATQCPKEKERCCPEAA